MMKHISKSRSLTLILCMMCHALRRNVLNTLTAAQRHWVYAIPPLSSKPQASRMVFKGIMCFALVFFFLSCRSVSSVESLKSNVESQDVQTFISIDTVLQHDSIYVYERTKGDTVYLTRTEWRERWRTQIVHDTIRDTQYITQTIEKPPVRYVPKFYRWCTIALWAIGLLAMGYWLLKWWLKPKSVIRL